MKRTFLVSLGTFDGLHRGHRKLIAMLRADARRLGLKVLVALFAEPPRFYFQPRSRASLLTTASERKSLLLELGVDRVEVLRFDSKLASMSHERFFDEVLLRRFQAGGLVAGPDFAFGKGRKGDCAYLRRACARHGLHFRTLPPVRSGPAKISSSGIRDLLRCGKVERAAKLLGRPYSVSGKVIRGRGLGAKIGFPTANLRVEGRLLPMGVFEVLVRGAAGTAPSGSGERPPFGDRGPLAAAREERLARGVQHRLPPHRREGHPPLRTSRGGPHPRLAREPLREDPGHRVPPPPPL